MHADEQRRRARVEALLARLEGQIEAFLAELEAAVGDDPGGYARVAAQGRALAAELAAARDAGDADPLGELVLAALREAHQPLRESVLYERVRERGAAVSPEEFVALAADLATLGRVRVTVEHDLPARDRAPFQPRFYRPTG